MSEVRDRLERAFEAWGRFAYRHAWWVVIAMLLGTAALASQLPTLRMDTSTESFFHQDDPVRIAYDDFRRSFGSDTSILLALEPPAVFDLGFLGTLRELHRAIEEEVPYLVEVTSLVNARETRGEADSLIVGELMEDWPETRAELGAIEARARANPLYEDFLISKDGRLTSVVVEISAYSSAGGEAELGGFDDRGFGDDEAPTADQPFLTGEETSEIIDALETVVARFASPELPIHVSGSPVMMDHIQRGMRTDMTRFAGLAIALVMIFLALLFRRVAGVVLPLVTVLLSVLSTIAVMALSGTPLTTPTQILPTFLLAVGIGGSVHILAIFYQARRRGESKREAIVYSLGHSGLAVMMTSLTTAGGLLSFTAAELAPIAHLGVFAPIGVMVALVFTLVLLPALVSIFPMREEQRPARAGELAPTQRAVLWLGEVSCRNAGVVAGAWVVLLVLAAVGTTQVRLSHHPFHWFKPGHPVRAAADVLNDRMGGAVFVEFLVRTPQENGLKDPELLHAFEDVARFAAGVTHGEMRVSKTLSLADVVKETNQALNENRSAYYAVPDDPLLVSQELLLFENSGSDDLDDFTDSSFSEGRITMKIPFLDAVGFPPFFDLLREGVDERLGDRADFVLTGMGVLAGETLTAVMHSMVRSYTIALAVIVPLLVLLVGRLRLGLLAMVPNIAPILLTLGVMGWFDFPLDTFTLMIGSIAIGLAVDDTIHFMHNFRRYHDRTGDVVEAVRETLITTGQALLFTSLVLSTGFAIYMFATMDVLFNFGLLTAIAIVAAFLADATFAPALLVLAAGRREADAAIPAPQEVP